MNNTGKKVIFTEVILQGPGHAKGLVMLLNGLLGAKVHIERLKGKSVSYVLRLALPILTPDLALHFTDLGFQIVSNNTIVLHPPESVLSFSEPLKTRSVEV